jgi:hypothetical protein
MTTNTKHKRARAPRDKNRHWKRFLGGALVLLLMTAFLAACGTADQQAPAGTELPGADIATEIAAPEAMATEPVPVTGDEDDSGTITGTTEAGDEDDTSEITGTTEAGDDTGTITGTTEPGADMPGGTLTLSDLTDNPDAYAGQNVAVEGLVALALNPNVFTISDPQLVELGQVLVINTNQTAMTPTIEEGQSVRVSGMVDRFDQAEIESQLGGIDVPGALLSAFEGQVMIMAESVEVTDGSQ